MPTFALMRIHLRDDIKKGIFPIFLSQQMNFHFGGK
jgi:hypothetical protein